MPAGGVRVELGGNATLSDNHFVHYTEHWGATSADDVRYDGKALAALPLPGFAPPPPCRVAADGTVTMTIAPRSGAILVAG